MTGKFTLFPIHHSPGFLIHRLDTTLALGLSRAFQAAGYAVTPEHWGVLSQLWEEEGVHQSELAMRSAKDRHNMTRILAVLEKNGYIVRRADRTDRRRRKVYLTETGRGLKPRLTPVVEHFLETVLAGISAEELARMQDLHLKIIANVEAISAEGSSS